MFPLTLFLLNCYYSLNSWSEYYSDPDIGPNVFGISQKGRYQNIKAGNLYIFQVDFSCTSNTQGNGGVILLQTSVKLLIDSSNFINCSSTGDGGSIYCKNSNCQCVLNMVCSANSLSATNYNFCFSEVNGLNFIEHSTIACTNTLTGKGNIELASGNIKLNYNNISNNVCYNICAFHCKSSSNISYSTLINNTSDPGDGVIDLRSYDNTGVGSSTDHNIKKCNIIRNKNGAGECQIISVFGTLQIYESYMVENNVGKEMFLAEVSITRITISNCTIDNLKRRGGGSIREENKPQKHVSNDLDGLHYMRCLQEEGVLELIIKITCPTILRFWKGKQLPLNDFKMLII